MGGGGHALVVKLTVAWDKTFAVPVCTRKNFVPFVAQGLPSGFRVSKLLLKFAPPDMKIGPEEEPTRTSQSTFALAVIVAFPRVAGGQICGEVAEIVP